MFPSVFEVITKIIVSDGTAAFEVFIYFLCDSDYSNLCFSLFPGHDHNYYAKSLITRQ